jgi:hypothetical protein
MNNHEEKFLARNHTLKTFEEKKVGFIKKFRTFLYQKYGILDLLDFFPYRWRMFYYDKIKPIFKPQHSRLRKVIPKTWMDISHLIVDVNLEFIKAFYEDEYSKDLVDWNATPQHKEFSKWIEGAYKYAKQTRPQLEKDLENSYPPSKNFEDMFKPIIDENGERMYQYVSDDVPYEKKYAEVIRLEQLIDNNDTDFIIQMIKFRHYFWT